MTERSSPASSHVEALRGGGALAVSAALGVIDIVEEMHCTIASGPALLGKPLEGPARAVTSTVYGLIRDVAFKVGGGLDAALAQLAPLLGEGTPGPQREAVRAALNGVLGDYLAATGNPLAIGMELRSEGAALPLDPDGLRAALPHAGGELLVLVHGSSTGDLQWRRNGHDHGAALARDLGYTPVYVRYNSGLHISTNGRELAHLLERLVQAWPVPLEGVALLGHSMGGLVARSACLAADDAGLLWRRKLRKLVCLGTPHHGAPLERGGSWVDLLLSLSRYTAPFARLGQLRSVGVTDLRYGNVLDAHWQGQSLRAAMRDVRQSLSLPEGVDCYAMAATPANALAPKLPGDGLVPVDSALGLHQRPELTLAFPEHHRWVALGTRHLDLLDAPKVYETLRAWLSR